MCHNFLEDFCEKWQIVDRSITCKTLGIVVPLFEDWSNIYNIALCHAPKGRGKVIRFLFPAKYVELCCEV